MKKIKFSVNKINFYIMVVFIELLLCFAGCGATINEKNISEDSDIRNIKVYVDRLSKTFNIKKGSYDKETFTIAAELGKYIDQALKTYDDNLLKKEGITSIDNQGFLNKYKILLKGIVNLNDKNIRIGSINGMYSIEIRKGPGGAITNEPRNKFIYVQNMDIEKNLRYLSDKLKNKNKKSKKEWYPYCSWRFILDCRTGVILYEERFKI